jgi:hypothetical protein
MSAQSPFAEFAEADAAEELLGQAPSGEGSADLSGAYVRFESSGELYALPLAGIREVVQAAGYSRIPRAPAAVIGLINHGGRIHTVVDLAALVRAEAARPRDFILLIDDPARRLGLGADRIDGIGSLEVKGEIARHGHRAVTVIRPESFARDVDHAFESAPVLTSTRSGFAGAGPKES